MRKFYLTILIIIYSVFISCSLSETEKPQSLGDENVSTLTGHLTLACWNTQTFFDAENDGTEYTDFKNQQKWSKDKYLMRLERLCQVMTTLNPDVMVLEEIENSAVVQDIANQLAGNAWSKKNNWNYGTFAKNKGAAIGCAVFSKYPLENCKVHNLDIRTQCKTQPESRPLLQADLEVEGKQITIFVNHWKSKSGGEEETEIWRDWQELVCLREIARLKKEVPDWACVLCGDFNRDAVDFVDKGLFRGAEGTEKLYSPWFSSSGAPVSGIGSYYYQGKWERIDNIFLGGEISISSFAPKRNGEWADSKGVPNSFKIFSGEGYSDHLPLLCVLRF